MADRWALATHRRRRGSVGSDLMGEAERLEERIRRVGRALGLDAVGFAGAGPTPRTEFVREWWARGYGGEMHYIGRRLEERVDPRRILPEAVSLIVVGLACPPEPESRPAAGETVAPAVAQRRATGAVARYAGGDDYHDVLLDRVRALEEALPGLAAQPVRSRSYVDTGPVSERAAAERAGLGWIAKNSCLIHPELGSHLMLGVILCDLELEEDASVADRCGTCRACLDVCPTDAFAEPYVLDARRCISYTTIESRGSIPESMRTAHAEHIFGCDLCQAVCPWNRSRPRSPLPDPLGLRERLAKREEWLAPTLEWILDLDEAGFRSATRRTALRRPGRVGLLRNALVAAGNSSDARLLECVRRFVEDADPILSEHARWALARLEAVERCGADPFEARNA
ncbi:MAG: tRNA epoxyqueuosine(34) reductase QueG [bacterium]|nr:tRNA epoxyqueuosine(34) reductase QueG [Deltaproteobacteria bacterium]MCP4909012.1 tRNA epoxyqueuosine(34) reductase QueG [bacterium]